MKVKAVPTPFEWGYGIDILMFDEQGHTAVEMCKAVEVPAGGRIPTAFRLKPEEAQMLMDSLWDAGVRPSEGSGSAGSLKATQEHLKDMRVLAFSALGIESDAV